MSKPWERQEKESSQAFEAFRTYLEMGIERSYTKVATVLKKSDTIIGRWGTEWKWQNRIRAYDNFLVEEQDKQVKNSIKQRFGRFGGVSDAIMAKAMESFNLVTPQNMSLRDTFEAMRMAIQFAEKNREVMLPEGVEDESMSEALVAALLEDEDEIS